MSNLGLYKVMTTMAKKVGGPKNLFYLTAGGGYGVCRLLEAGIKKIVKLIKKFKDKSEDFPEYTLEKDFTFDSRLVLLKNEKIRVVDEFEEEVLVARESDLHPFYMLKEDLRKISSYS